MTRKPKSDRIKLLKRKKRGARVTVCIAAIYNNNAVLGASDRMITAGDIEFEPPTPKIISLTNSIVVMTAGDANLQAQILVEARSFVTKKINENSKKWINVSDVANLYRDTYIKLRAEAAERAILAPFELTFESFTALQGDDFVDDLTANLQNFVLDDVGTIVTGLDENGAHIFTVYNDEVRNDDSVGFAAVGSGSWHALSHMMLSGHAASATETKTLLTIHQAKKKSEVSPGVGEGTDMFVIGPKLGSLTMFDPLPQFNLVKDLDDFYKKYKDELIKLDEQSESELQDYLNKLTDRTAQSQQANPTAAEVKVTDDVRVSDKIEVAKDEKNEPTKK